MGSAPVDRPPGFHIGDTVYLTGAPDLHGRIVSRSAAYHHTDGPRDPAFRNDDTLWVAMLEDSDHYPRGYVIATRRDSELGLVP